MIQKIPVTCNKDCAGGCPLLAHIEDGRVTKITDNPAGGPHMHGCIKGYHAARILYAPDRVKKPLLRTGPRGSGSFRAAEWPEALDLVADRLAEIKARYGPESIFQLGDSGSYRGSLHNTSRLTARFLSLLGGYTCTRGSYSQAAAEFVTPLMLGTLHAGVDAGALQFSNLIILWGANIADCRAGSETESRIREAKQRGVPVIVIDPRCSNTVRQLGTRWIPVRPGTDSALMMAVLYVLIGEGLIDRNFIARYSAGFDALEERIRGRDGGDPCTPEWAESVCGTPAGVIVELARLYGQTRPAALVPGLSIQRTIGGEDAFRMAITLQTVTGNLGVPGGSSGGHIFGGLPRPRVGMIGAPVEEEMPAVPVVRWPDAILEGKAGGYPTDLKAIYNVGGNYVGQGSDLHKSIRAFEKVEFSVCHDYFLTPTARYCDVLLPATTFLERNDIVFPTSGNYLLFSNQAVPPLADSRNDYDIFCGLAGNLGFLEDFCLGKSEDDWLRSFVAASDVPDYDEFRRTGIHLFEDRLRVAFSDFVADPGGHPLATPSGKVEIRSAEYGKTGFSAIPECRMLEPSAHYPLRLITPKSRHRVHSQASNIPYFMEREQHALWMNPIDAATRDIENGAPVLVSSPQGKTRVAARITDDIMPGVVCLVQGGWPSLDAEGVDTAGCANVLTSTEPTLPSQGSRTHSVLVEVESFSLRIPGMAPNR